MCLTHERLLDVSKDLATPCFVFDELQLRKSVEVIREAAVRTPIELLYSMKACSTIFVLNLVAEGVSGFSCSSPYEARLAREVLGDAGSVHVTSPALSPADLEQLATDCDFVTFNSLSQAARGHGLIGGDTSRGLRVNPQFSLLDDERYDPCRRASKLGVPIRSLERVQREQPDLLYGVTGLHVHTNSDSACFSQLAKTVDVLHRRLGPTLARCGWVNLGGGYLFEESSDLCQLWSAIELLSSKYRLRIFLEPGAAVVRKCGSLVATVVDLFESDDRQVTVLDTSVNHMPEVFEYQFEPEVLQHRAGGAHRYLLAGSTCLAGDMFGEYEFDEPLDVGSRVIFCNMGSYTVVKANWFNGVPLPSIYSLSAAGLPKLEQTFSYADFRRRQGGDDDAHL